MTPTEKRIVDALRWANKPIAWSLRFFRSPGPFRAVRKLPLIAVCKAMEFHILLLKK